MQKQLTTMKKTPGVAGGMVEIVVGIVKQEKDILVHQKSFTKLLSKRIQKEYNLSPSC